VIGVFFGVIVIVLRLSRFGVIFEGDARSQIVPSGLAPESVRPRLP
jgi:hypothetical protein